MDPNLAGSTSLSCKLIPAFAGGSRDWNDRAQESVCCIATTELNILRTEASNVLCSTIMDPW